jgi:hypothetical protein
MIRGAYPWQTNGLSEDVAELMLNVWHDVFKDYEAKHVLDAVRYVIKHDTSGYVPSIGVFVQRTEVEKERPVYTQEQIDRVKRIKAQ